jgi:hypothetical protein
MGHDSKNPKKIERQREPWMPRLVKPIRQLFGRSSAKKVRITAVKSRPVLSLPVDELLHGIAEQRPNFSSTHWETRASALEIAVAQNAYETAEILAEEALSHLDDCPTEHRRKILRCIVDNLAARGESRRIIELIAKNKRELPKKGYAPEFFVDDVRSGTVDFSDYHAIYRAITSGQLSIEALTSFLASDRINLVETPQLNLLAFYAARRLGQRGFSESALTRYFESEGLRPLEVSSVDSENVLQDLREKSPSFSFLRRQRQQGPLVSIVCSAYRAKSTLGYAVRSLLAQTYPFIEVLLCDDGSDDETLTSAKELAKQDSRIRLFRSKGNQGTYNVRNALIAKARGQYITFHDSDDYAIPTRIETQLLAISELNARACVANWVRILNNGLSVFFRDGKEKRLSIVSLMVERDTMLQILPYRSARHSADLEMYERLLAQVGTGAIARIHAPLVLGLWSNQSLTRGCGSEALENGFRASSRRRYAELCFRQHLLGKDRLSDTAIDTELRNMGNYLEPRPVEELT